MGMWMSTHKGKWAERAVVVDFLELETQAGGRQ